MTTPGLERMVMDYPVKLTKRPKASQSEPSQEKAPKSGGVRADDG